MTRYLAFFLFCLVYNLAEAQQISQPAPATSVATNAVLLASSTAAFPNGVWRNTHTAGVTAPAPPLLYLPSNGACSLNSGNGDSGSQVKSSDGKCWLAQFPDRGRVDIRQFGAKPNDGSGPVVDTAPYLLTAFTAGVGIYLPGSLGRWEFSTNVTLANNRLKLTGDYPEEYTTTGVPSCPPLMTRGTWVHIGTPGVSLVNLAEGVAGPTFWDTWGSDIGNLGICQDHPPPAPSWQPTVYPPVFNLSSTQGCHVHDIYYYGVYDGTNADNSARCSHTNIRGQVFRYTWTGDHLLDATYLTNFHIWAFWSYDNSVRDWQLANGDVIYPKRVDGLNLTNIFGFAYRSCLRLGSSGSGIPTGMVGMISCDASKYAVLNQANNTYGNILNISLGGENAPGSEGFRNEGGTAIFQIGNIFCFSVGQSCIHDANPNGNSTFSVGTAFSYGYDKDATGTAAWRIVPAQPNVSYIHFGAAPVAVLAGGSGVQVDDGGTGIISVGGWYTKNFTPVLTFNDLNVGMVVASASGSYTRNILTEQTFGRIRMTLSNKGSSVGGAVIRGMPSFNVVRAGTGAAGFYNNMALPVGGMTGYVPEGGGAGVQLLTANTTGTPFLTNTAFTNTSDFNISFSFNN